MSINKQETQTQKKQIFLGFFNQLPKWDEEQKSKLYFVHKIFHSKR